MWRSELRDSIPLERSAESGHGDLEGADAEPGAAAPSSAGTRAGAARYVTMAESPGLR
jgi:hypothetical protein